VKGSSLRATAMAIDEEDLQITVRSFSDLKVKMTLKILEMKSFHGPYRLGIESLELALHHFSKKQLGI
jgi:hypothetical protein